MDDAASSAAPVADARIPDDNREHAAPEWPARAADTVEQVVATVRDRTVVPARSATRALVFGLLAAFFLLPALVLAGIGIFRLVDAYLPGETWATWLLFGGIFLVAGALLWSRREAAPAPD